MQPSKRRRGTSASSSAIGEAALIIGLATLAVVQGAAAAWGVIAGTMEMFRLLLTL